MFGVFWLRGVDWRKQMRRRKLRVTCKAEHSFPASTLHLLLLTQLYFIVSILLTELQSNYSAARCITQHGFRRVDVQGDL